MVALDALLTLIEALDLAEVLDWVGVLVSKVAVGLCY